MKEILGKSYFNYDDKCFFKQILSIKERRKVTATRETRRWNHPHDAGHVFDRSFLSRGKPIHLDDRDRSGGDNLSGDTMSRCSRPPVHQGRTLLLRLDIRWPSQITPDAGSQDLFKKYIIGEIDKRTTRGWTWATGLGRRRTWVSSFEQGWLLEISIDISRRIH